MEFNVIPIDQSITSETPEPVLVPIDTEKVLDRYRDPQSGQIGVKITIRPPNDDPFCIFGYPGYYFQKKVFIVQTGLDE